MNGAQANGAGAFYVGVPSVTGEYRLLRLHCHPAQGFVEDEPMGLADPDLRRGDDQVERISEAGLVEGLVEVPSPVRADSHHDAPFSKASDDGRSFRVGLQLEGPAGGMEVGDQSLGVLLRDPGGVGQAAETDQFPGQVVLTSLRMLVVLLTVEDFGAPEVVGLRAEGEASASEDLFERRSPCGSPCESAVEVEDDGSNQGTSAAVKASSATTGREGATHNQPKTVPATAQ